MKIRNTIILFFAFTFSYLKGFSSESPYDSLKKVNDSIQKELMSLTKTLAKSNSQNQTYERRERQARIFSLILISSIVVLLVCFTVLFIKYKNYKKALRYITGKKEGPLLSIYRHHYTGKSDSKANDEVKRYLNQQDELIFEQHILFKNVNDLLDTDVVKKSLLSEGMSYLKLRGILIEAVVASHDRKLGAIDKYKPSRIEANKGSIDVNLSSKKDDVNLALSYPKAVKPNQNFTIRVSAYLQDDKANVQNFLQAMAPKDQHLMDADNCKWQHGAIVKVRVYSSLLQVLPESQEFEWRGKSKILNFDALVNHQAPIGDYLTIKADILIADIVIARLRADILIDVVSSSENSSVNGTPIKTAFASYASADTNFVVGRLSEIERNGVKIFWDRISLQTGKDWQSQLSKAIMDNQAFLLFWSNNAKSSEYVTWEWKTALKNKGLDAIDPHPLESPSTAPPPEELSSLHFDDKYLYFRK